MHEIYKRFYTQRIFTLNDALKVIKNEQVCKNTLSRLTKQGYLKRLRNQLYSIIPPDQQEPIIDQVIVGTLLRKDAVLSNLTALQMHKLYPDMGKTPILYIVAKHAAKTQIKDTTYRISKNTHTIGIQPIKYLTKYQTAVEIKITDLERTLIDCVWSKTIKAQELVSILRNKPVQIRIDQLFKYLERYNKPVLYHKIGFILSLAQKNLNITPEELEKFRKKLSKKIYYYKEPGFKLIRPRYRYHKPWNIMLPEELYALTQEKSPTAT